MWLQRCIYTCILANGTITTTATGNDDAGRRLDEWNKGVIF